MRAGNQIRSNMDSKSLTVGFFVGSLFMILIASILIFALPKESYLDNSKTKINSLEAEIRGLRATILDWKTENEMLESDLQTTEQKVKDLEMVVEALGGKL